MGNMSYCRFENTARDLRDCVEAINNNETEDLNNYERDGLEELLILSKEIVDMEDYINDILNEDE
tara:strand:+ start:219 stop:413 length:195 start_codon:yes stop_codon:yes gene_type:complete